MKKLFVDIVIFLSSAVLAETDPCQRYDLLSMHDGRRLVNYRTQRLDIPICDRIYVRTGWWYKFAYNETNYKIPEDCAQFGSCGTITPIWMQGPHPSDYGRIQRNRLCVNTGRSCCDLTASVNVTRCRSGHGGDFYIYQLTDPSTCHLGFCVTPSEENKYEGNEIQCDRRLGCSQVTVDHARHIGFVFEHSFICNYVDVDEGTNVTYRIISRTSTTAQCPVPDEIITQKYKSITKRYDLTVKYRNSRKPGIHVWGPTVRVVVQNIEDDNDDGGSGVDLSFEVDEIELGSGEDDIEHSSSALIEPSTTKSKEFLDSGATSSKVSMQLTLAFRSGELDTTTRSQVPAETNTAEVGKSLSTTQYLTNSNRYSDDTETFTASGLTLETSFETSTLAEPSDLSLNSTLVVRSSDMDTTTRSQVPAHTTTAEVGKSSSTTQYLISSNGYSDKTETFRAPERTPVTSFEISTLVEPSETERATTSLTTSQQSMTDSYSLSQTATETDIDAVSETLLV